MVQFLGTIAAVVGLLALAGCRTPQVVIGPDGQSALQVRCNRYTQYRCSQKAEQICSPGGYQVMDNGVRNGTVVTPNGYVVPNQWVFQGFMVIRCR